MTIRSDHPRNRCTARAALVVALGLASVTTAVVLAVVGNRMIEQASARWNVVLVTLDTTRADRLGCYGAPRADTPAIDRLSDAGIRYRRCYSPAPLTQPGHASILTGLLPPRHRLHDNGPEALSLQIDTLAELLSRHGYETGAVVGAFVLDREFGFAQGFDDYDDDLSRGSPAGKFRYAERDARQVTDSALRWMDQRSNSPFFLWVHYFDPHAPYAPPGYNPKFTSRSAYDAELAYVDSQLARLLQKIDDSGGRPTLIIVTSDHGEGLGQHGEPTHGLFTYDSTMRVPLIVRLPDDRGSGRLIDTPVSIVDIVPSILSWLSLDVPPGLDGLPLPVRTDTGTSAEPPKRAIYLENRFVTTEYGWAALSGIVVGREKFIHAPRPEFYDLESDPHERTNLYRPDNARCLQLQRRHKDLLAHLASQPGFAPQEMTLDDSDLKKLAALGYVAHATPRTSEPELVLSEQRDPKDMVDVYNRIQSVTTSIERGRHDAASRVLIDIIRNEDPRNPRVLRLLAMLCRAGSEKRGDVLDCLLEVANSSRRDLLDTFALGKLGEALVLDRRFESAIDILQRLVERQPQHAAAFRYLGDAHAATGQPQQALRAYRRALHLTSTLREPPPWIDHVLAEIQRLSR